MPNSGSLLLFPSLLIILILEVGMAHNTTIPVNVGVVLDVESSLGKMGLSCISMALSDFYASHGDYRTRLVLKTRDSRKDVGAAAAGTQLTLFSSSIFVML